MSAMQAFSHLDRRITDLAIKFLVKRQHRRLVTTPPRLAVVPTEHVGLAITAGGLYEPDEIALLTSLVNAAKLQNTVMLDIGANIGNHTCSLAAYFSQILAFEPNPPIAALLRANVLMNDRKNVIVHEVGLAAKDAELSFGIFEAGNDGSGSFAEGGTEKTLPVRRGDAYLKKHAPDLIAMKQRIGFIKCDVQGFEPDVFAGLGDILAKHQPMIMFESDKLSTGNAAWAILKNAGYRHLTRMRAPGDDSGKLSREWARLRNGTGCWLEPISEIPEKHCNLIASVQELPSI